MHAILVHGWKGWPENGWFPWLQRELEARGFITQSLKLPNPAFPDRETWTRIVKKAIKGPDTVLVGHSLGCPSILFALEAYDGDPVERVVCVSGFGRKFTMPLLDLWIKGKKIDFDRVKKKAKHWSVIHSAHDYLVPYKEGEWLAKQLGVDVIRTKARGHLIHEERCFELPEALEAIVSSERAS
jgi:predicted alpha/beta hydrolase family esterase